MSKLLSNLFMSYSASIFGFLISLLAARMLGATEYAWMAFGLAVAGFLIPILNLGNERSFIRDAVAIGNRNGIGEMVNASFNIRMILTVLFAIILAVLSYYHADSASDTIAMFSISLWASLLGLYPASWYDYLGKTRYQNFMILIERFSSFLLVAFLFVLPNTLHLAWIVGTVLLIIRVIFISIQVTVWWKIFGNGRFKWFFPNNLKNIKGVNYRITSALFCNAILTYGNQLLLSGYGDKSELASYGLVFQIISLIFIFQGLGIRLISLQIAMVCSKKIGVFHSIVRNALLLALGSVVMSFVVWIGIKYLPKLLSDPRYDLMNKFSSLLCIWVVVAGVGQVVNQYSMALHQESTYLLLAIVGGVIAIIMGFIFVPQYGGIAAATILLCVHSSLIFVEILRVAYIVNKTCKT